MCGCGLYVQQLGTKIKLPCSRCCGSSIQASMAISRPGMGCGGKISQEMPPWQRFGTPARPSQSGKNRCIFGNLAEKNENNLDLVAMICFVAHFLRPELRACLWKCTKSSQLEQLPLWAALLPPSSRRSPARRAEAVHSKVQKRNMWTKIAQTHGIPCESPKILA